MDVRGEILELKNTINTMVDQLNGFAAKLCAWRARSVTRVSSGGQAEVKGVAGVGIPLGMTVILFLRHSSFEPGIDRHSFVIRHSSFVIDQH